MCVLFNKVAQDRVCAQLMCNNNNDNNNRNNNNNKCVKKVLWNEHCATSPKAPDSADVSSSLTRPTQSQSPRRGPRPRLFYCPDNTPERPLAQTFIIQEFRGCNPLRPYTECMATRIACGQNVDADSGALHSSWSVLLCRVWCPRSDSQASLC